MKPFRLALSLPLALLASHSYAKQCNNFELVRVLASVGDVPKISVTYEAEGYPDSRRTEIFALRQRAELNVSECYSHIRNPRVIATKYCDASVYPVNNVESSLALEETIMNNSLPSEGIPIRSKITNVFLTFIDHENRDQQVSQQIKCP